MHWSLQGLPRAGPAGRSAQALRRDEPPQRCCRATGTAWIGPRCCTQQVRVLRVILGCQGLRCCTQQVHFCAVCAVLPHRDVLPGDLLQAGC